MHCNSRFNSPTENMLVRYLNSFIGAMNKFKSTPLPQYIIVVPEDDLITYLDFQGVGVAQLFGTLLTWLSQQFKEVIDTKKSLLPVKSQLNSQPCIYCIVPPLHNNFSKGRNDLRCNFGFCLETLLKGCSDMRVIKLKEHWDVSRQALVSKDKITQTRLFAY